MILLLIQAGGLGIMTLASLFAVLVSRRLGSGPGWWRRPRPRRSDRRRRDVIRAVVLFSVAAEAAVAVVLTVRFALGYDRTWSVALYDGVFHAVSAFNNAGFRLNADSLVAYVTDPWISPDRRRRGDRRRAGVPRRLRAGPVVAPSPDLVGADPDHRGRDRRPCWCVGTLGMLADRGAAIPRTLGAWAG